MTLAERVRTGGVPAPAAVDGNGHATATPDALLARAAVWEDLLTLVVDPDSPKVPRRGERRRLLSFLLARAGLDEPAFWRMHRGQRSRAFLSRWSALSTTTYPSAPPKAPIPAPFSRVSRGVEQPRNADATDKPTRAVNARFMISLSRRLKSAAISTTRPSVALDAHSLFLVDRARPGSAAPVAVDPAAFVLVPSAGRRSRRRR